MNFYSLNTKSIAWLRYVAKYCTMYIHLYKYNCI